MEQKTELERELEELHAASFAWTLSCCDSDRTEAEDVLQMVYLKILEGKARFDGQSSLKTWLFAVIRNTAHEGRRRRRIRSLLLAKFWNQEPYNRSPADGKIASDIDKALSKLPARQREVLDLVFYHDLTIEAAAEVMGVSIGSARTHYSRGKKNLRKALRQGESR